MSAPGPAAPRQGPLPGEMGGYNPPKDVHTAVRVGFNHRNAELERTQTPTNRQSMAHLYKKMSLGNKQKQTSHTPNGVDGFPNRMPSGSQTRALTFRADTTKPRAPDIRIAVVIGEGLGGPPGPRSRGGVCWVRMGGGGRTWLEGGWRCSGLSGTVLSPGAVLFHQGHGFLS